MSAIVVLVLDVGSLVNIGWWRSLGDECGRGGRGLDDFVNAVVADLDAGRRVALGFESPLFIPRPASSSGLSKQRLGEGGRPWCAGAGSGVLALGLQQAAYTFARISGKATSHPRVTFDPGDLTTGTAELAVWEAFVSGRAKNRDSMDPHVDDARAAAREFHRRIAVGSVSSDVDEPDVLNLAAAGLLASGLTADVALLTKPCVVVKAPPYLPAAP